MSEPNRGRSRTPWIVAGALAVVVAALAVLLVHVASVRDEQEHAGTEATAASAPAALTRSQQEAVTSGATEAANLVSYSRKSFQADFARALAGATGALAKDVHSEKAKTLAQMTKNKIDLKGSVEHSAYAGTDGSRNVLVLVTVNGYSVNDKRQRSAANTQRVELTMTKSGGKWLATNLTSIGIR